MIGQWSPYFSPILEWLLHWTFLAWNLLYWLPMLLRLCFANIWVNFFVLAAVPSDNACMVLEFSLYLTPVLSWWSCCKAATYAVTLPPARRGTKLKDTQLRMHSQFVEQVCTTATMTREQSVTSITLYRSKLLIDRFQWFRSTFVPFLITLLWAKYQLLF